MEEPARSDWADADHAGLGSLGEFPADELGVFVLSCLRPAQQLQLRQCCRGAAALVASVVASDVLESGLSVLSETGGSASDVVGTVRVSDRAAAFCGAVRYDGYRLDALMRRQRSPLAVFAVAPHVAQLIADALRRRARMLATHDGGEDQSVSALADARGRPAVGVLRCGTATPMPQLDWAALQQRACVRFAAAEDEQLDDGAHVSLFAPVAARLTLLMAAAPPADAPRAARPRCNTAPYEQVFLATLGDTTAREFMAANRDRIVGLDVARAAASDDLCFDLPARLPNLRTVRLGPHTARADALLAALALQCRQLRHIDVSLTAGAVSDASIGVVAAHRAADLTYLDVSATGGRVTDASLAALVVAAPRLVYLALGSNGGAITAKTVTAVATSCPDLEDLDLVGLAVDAPTLQLVERALQRAVVLSDVRRSA